VNDRYAQTVGFVVAGVGLAATFLDWAPVAELVTLTAGGFAGLAALAFALRRHGSGPDWLDAVAAVAGGGGLVLASAYAILGITGTLPRGPLLALLAGLAAVSAGAAAVAGLEKAGVHERERRTFVAVVVSIAALLFGGLLAAVVVAFLPANPLVQVPVNTTIASVGYGIAGIVFVRSFDGGIDVSRPDRRDLLVAGVGVVAIFAVHVLLNVVVSTFSLPRAPTASSRRRRPTPRFCRRSSWCRWSPSVRGGAARATASRSTSTGVLRARGHRRRVARVHGEPPAGVHRGWRATGRGARDALPALPRLAGPRRGLRANRRPVRAGRRPRRLRRRPVRARLRRVHVASDAGLTKYYVAVS